MNFFDDPSKIVIENRKVKDYLLNVCVLNRAQL